jgi:cell division protein FtsN
MRKLFLIVVCLLPIGCIRVYYTIAPEFHSQGTVSVDGRVDADDPRVTVTVDDVAVDWKDLKTLVEQKMANLPKEGSPAAAAVPVQATSPATPAPHQATAAAMDPPRRMTHSIQVGAYRHLENAEQEAARLTSIGYQARVQKFADSRNGTWYTVRIGDYPTAESARSMADEFFRREKMETAVRPFGSL